MRYIKKVPRGLRSSRQELRDTQIRPGETKSRPHCIMFKGALLQSALLGLGRGLEPAHRECPTRAGTRAGTHEKPLEQVEEHQVQQREVWGQEARAPQSVPKMAGGNREESKGKEEPDTACPRRNK